MIANLHSMCLALLLLAAAVGTGGCEKKKADLICHVGGTMQPAMKELAALYRQKTGRTVEINTAGSGELLAHIEGLRRGDVYVCHDPFMQMLMDRGLGADGWTVAELVAVIVVAKGDSRVRGVADLADPNISLALTDYEKSTLGHMLGTIFQKAGVDLKRVAQRPNVQTFRKGGQAANAVKLGSADAAIVWNAVAHLRTDALDVVPIVPEHLPTPHVDALTSATGRTYRLTPVRVTISTLRCSRRADVAKDFAQFVASDQAAEVFRKFGYATLPVRQEYQDGRRLQ